MDQTDPWCNLAGASVATSQIRLVHSPAEFGLRGQGIHGQKTDLIHSPTVGETSVF